MDLCKEVIQRNLYVAYGIQIGCKKIMVLYKIKPIIWTGLLRVTTCTKIQVRGHITKVCMHVGQKPTYYGPRKETSRMSFGQQEVTCDCTQERSNATSNANEVSTTTAYSIGLPWYLPKVCQMYDKGMCYVAMLCCCCCYCIYVVVAMLCYGIVAMIDYGYAMLYAMLSCMRYAKYDKLR